VPYGLPSNAFEVPTPNCAHPDTTTWRISTLHNGTLNLDPGLYCIDGDITINGGTIVAEGVTFYLATAA